MEIKELLSNPRIQQLSPIAFKAYCFLIEKAGDSKVIKNFSIRGQAKEWSINQNMNLTNNKITMKKILVELEASELIKVDFDKKELKVNLLNHLPLFQK